MKNFNEFLQDRDSEMYTELFGFGGSKKPVPSTPAHAQEEDPNSPMAKLNAMRKSALAGFKPDQDQAKDDKEAEYLASWRRSKKK